MMRRYTFGLLVICILAWPGIGVAEIRFINGGPAYVDYDDIAIHNQAPSNTDANGYPWIGPVGGLPDDDDPPPAPKTAMPVEILFSDPIEDTDFGGRGWYDNRNPAVSTSEAIPGSSMSLEYHFPVNATKPTRGGAMRKRITPSESVYISYYVKYSSGWLGSQRSYHPHEFYLLTNKDGQYEGMAYTNLTAYVEQNALQPRLAIQDSKNIDTAHLNEDLVGVTENRAVAGCNGDSDGTGSGTCYRSDSGDYRNGKHWDGASVLSPNTWHRVEAFFKFNSIQNGKGVANGVVRYWLDGELVIDHQKVMLRTAKHADMRFEQIVIAPWIGDGSPIDQTFWVDGVVVGVEDPGGTNTRPNPPSGLTVIE